MIQTQCPMKWMPAGKARVRSCITMGVLISTVLSAAKASAQIVTTVQPDLTLPVISEVNGAGNITVTGGTADLSGNLFHSFDQFSVGETDSVFFDLGAQTNNIETVITRVTGGAPSNIYGELGSGGTADFFLINPNGIVFGPEAVLEVSGSFISSTADSVLFSELSFSATDSTVPNNLSLLRLSTPIGLQYGNSSGSITVDGLGNNLFIDPVTFEIVRDFRPSGLDVDEGQTLALIGGDVTLTGGNLTAPQGQIALGGLSTAGVVSLIPANPGWQFVYPDNVSRGDVSLVAAAAADASSGGSIQIQGRQITFTDGSAALANTLDAVDGGGIRIEATEAVVAAGSSIDAVTQESLFPSGIFAEVAFSGTGTGGDIVINTPRLSLEDGGQLSTATFGDGEAGSISVAADDINVAGQSPDQFLFSGIFAFTDLFAIGDGGDITLETDTLSLAQGAEISTTTFGVGEAGNLSVQAQDVVLSDSSGLFANTAGEGAAGDLRIQAQNIALTGDSLLAADVGFDATGQGGNLELNVGRLLVDTGSQIGTGTFGFGDAGSLEINAQSVALIGVSEFAPSGLFTDATFDSFGQGGSLTLRTNQLRILDGAQIGTTTFGPGDAGDLTVLAESIEIAGGSDRNRSGLLATALVEDGNGGNLSIVTDQLELRDRAIISVSTFPTSEGTGLEPGQGAAGDLSIVARTALLDEQSVLSAETAAGDRGNIDIQTEQLVLRRGSRITTNATETASGGNIRIDASQGFLVAVPTENSDITANATVGNGGNVEIIAQGVLGIVPRPRLTPQSDITASSEFGLAGTVVLTTLGVEPDEGINQLATLQDIPRLAQGCEITNSTSRFISSGRSGLRATPYDALGSFELLGDIQPPQEWTTTANEMRPTGAIVEAQHWQTDAAGNVRLMAAGDISSCGRVSDD